jgi:ATP-dependent helicase/nuclease subunit A
MHRKKTQRKMPMPEMNRPLPPDQHERLRGLDPAHSVLVQAPAGSGKTDLLTRRFLALLAQVNAPGEIVAITFTRAAAAEMRHRILAQLEKATETRETAPGDDAFSMQALAHRALNRSQQLGWQLLDLPGQLRITTIDAFCRELALQQPLVTGLGGGLEIADQPTELYRRAARRTLETIDQAPDALRASIEDLLLWRDNNWAELEELLAKMLRQRDRWMHEFLFDRTLDEQALRAQLERPFAQAAETALIDVGDLLTEDLCEEAIELARFACTQEHGEQHQSLAELAEFPLPPYEETAELETALEAYRALANLLLTATGAFRARIDKNLGFPADRKREKQRLADLIKQAAAIPQLDSALSFLRTLPPVRYSEEEWRIVRAAFLLLTRAAAELRIVFAEVGATDFTEISQTSLNVLKGEDGIPSEATLAFADGIHHLLVDEFQDTSRRQHELLSRLIAAWPDQQERTCFVVGDPMQSIYFFRDAEAELFARVRELGLELPDAEPLRFDFAQLRANFRTAPALVDEINTIFASVFARDDGSGIRFTAAMPAREAADEAQPRLQLHLGFVPTVPRGRATEEAQRAHALAERTETSAAQIDEIISLIKAHQPAIEQTQAQNQSHSNETKKYRVAVLGRSRKALLPIAEKLRQAQIPFRALDLEALKDRPEVLDALSLARAVLNPQDRIAWLSVLRAPWCALALADLHALTSGDDKATLRRSIPELLRERFSLLSAEGQRSTKRLLDAFAALAVLRFAQPTAALGSWLEELWLTLGGAHCVDATGRANLDLLWRCLDRLPEGERDLLGPALDAALEDLTAEPDPTVSEDCGVQLMTMHKSKGLEFEIVIVPELQASSGRTDPALLSWLERGLAEPDEAGALTEFLIAPLQVKGAERGSAKAWVDGVRRARETQEMRRLLYVAATRAREELHFFARPAYTENKQGERILVEPKNSLLATAWPALEQQVRARFSAWAQQQEFSRDESEELVELAAQADPEQHAPTMLRRLPSDFPLQMPAHYSAEQGLFGTGADALYARHEGGINSRALGTATHGLLEELALLRCTLTWDAARAALAACAPRIIAQVRAAGLEPSAAIRIAEEAMQLALAASHDAIAQWILSPRPDAASEVRWTGIVEGEVRTVQMDRVFRAGAEPGEEVGHCWWIVDFKTAHADEYDSTEALPALRKLFAAQVELYAKVLRNLKGAKIEVRAALYYPRLAALDWWKI